jgi:GMP synthase-like glutamine amidotransferase
MKAHIFQHVPFEDIGSIRSWLETRQAEITYTRWGDNARLPELKGLDLLIVLGGPMSVNEEDAFPWLRPEKRFIRDAVLNGIPTLGICLGAQLIASAMGARIYKHAHKEIGWFDITATPNRENCFQFPERCLAFHWHGETFDLPPGAIHLARSQGCENQAFQIGRHVIGLQFHLETTPESIHDLVDNCRAELIPGLYIQTERKMQQVEPCTYVKINAIMIELLSYLTGVSS